MQANKFGRSGVGDRVRDGGRGTNGGPSPQKTEGHARKRRRVTDGRDGGRGHTTWGGGNDAARRAVGAAGWKGVGGDCATTGREGKR